MRAARSANADGEAQAERMIRLTTLGPLADTQAKKLSGGQRALLQMGCGFMVPGSCYVLDEPFAGINPVIKDVILDMIVEVNREQGAAFLVVSHEMAIIRKLCPQVTVMMEGRVAAQGTLDEVARLPPSSRAISARRSNERAAVRRQRLCRLPAGRRHPAGHVAHRAPGRASCW